MLIFLPDRRGSRSSSAFWVLLARLEDYHEDDLVPTPCQHAVYAERLRARDQRLGFGVVPNSTLPHASGRLRIGASQ